MTMAHILDEEVQSFSFRLEGVEQVVPYEYIRELLGFLKGAPEQVYVYGGTLEGFWSVIAGGAHQQRNNIRTHHPSMSLCCASGFLGRMRETKITNTELNWLYSTLIAKWPIDPSYLMINRRCCEQHRVREILVRGVTSLCWLSL
jgi:hypothetical protein